VDDSGCIDSSMECDSSIRKCAFKRCPIWLDNGRITLEARSAEFDEGPPNAVARMAVASCQEGFSVEHPDALVGIARGQHAKMDGDF